MFPESFQINFRGTLFLFLFYHLFLVAIFILLIFCDHQLPPLFQQEGHVLWQFACKV